MISYTWTIRIKLDTKSILPGCITSSELWTSLATSFLFWIHRLPHASVSPCMGRSVLVQLGVWRDVMIRHEQILWGTANKFARKFLTETGKFASWKLGRTTPYPSHVLRTILDVYWRSPIWWRIQVILDLWRACRSFVGHLSSTYTQKKCDQNPSVCHGYRLGPLAQQLAMSLEIGRLDISRLVVFVHSFRIYSVRAEAH